MPKCKRFKKTTKTDQRNSDCGWIGLMRLRWWCKKIHVIFEFRYHFSIGLWFRNMINQWTSKYRSIHQAQSEMEAFCVCAINFVDKSIIEVENWCAWRGPNTNPTAFRHKISRIFFFFWFLYVSFCAGKRNRNRPIKRANQTVFSLILFP